MNNTSGFYKLENTDLLYAPNFVESSEISLYSELHESYSYPADGWYWFDGVEKANEFFGLN